MATPDPASPRLRAYAGFLQRRAGLIALVFLLATAAFGLAARRLELRTDLEDLLPEGQPSVVALRKIMRRVGGVGTLNVAIQSDAPAAAERFAEDLVAALGRRLPDDIRYLDYTVTPVRAFLERHALLYLSVADLEALDDEVTAAVGRARLEANPLHVALDADDGPGLAARIDDVRARVRRRTPGADRFPRGYYEGEGGRLLVVFVRPAGSALGIRGARRLLARVERVVDDLDPRRYHPSLRVGYTGSIKVTVEEYGALVRDIAGTAALCITLVMLAVWLYFRRVRVLLLLGATLAAGVVWAFGLASLVFGYVNAQTAFLGSIIAGTGINYGLMLLARYQEERRGGRTPAEALPVALGAALRPTLVAALATGASFGALGIAHIRSFSQFGFIGGVGIVGCWFLSFTFLPALLCLFERAAWLRLRAARRPRLQLRYPAWLARLPVRHAGAVVVVTGVLLAGAAVAFVRFLPHALEADVNRLRNRSSLRSGTAVLDRRVALLYGTTLTPAVVLADGPDQARRICEAFDRRKASDPDGAPIEWCRSIHSFLPADQPRKLALIARLRRRLDDLDPARVPRDLAARLDEVRAHPEVRALGISDLPDEIRRRFRERDGTEGTVVLVAPRAGRDLWVFENLMAFSDALREVKLAGGEVVHSSGDAVVFADILRTIVVDAPRTTALAAACVLVVLALVLRRLRAVARVGAALTAGVALMVGIAAALRVKYNFFNFVALPTTFGIGVDYPVNIHQRCAEGGPGRIEEALQRTGPAVFNASLTTIIGYGVLLIADNQALRSFGALAILGELTCLAAALLLLPALAAVGERRAARRTRPAGGAAAPPTTSP